MRRVQRETVPSRHLRSEAVSRDKHAPSVSARPVIPALEPSTTVYPPVLIATQCFPPDVGGIETLMGQLAEALAVRGHHVDVHADKARARAPVDDAALFRSAGAGAVHVRRYGGIKPLRRRIKAWTISREVASGGYKAVLCDSWKSLELLDRTAIPCPVSVLIHSMEIPNEPSPAKRCRIEQAFSKADTVIAVSHFAADLVRPYLAPTARLEVINPAIAPQPAPSEAALARLKVEIGAYDTLVAGMARLEPRKGFDKVIDALPAVLKAAPGTIFALAGGGDDRVRLEDMAQAAGVADRVRFLGRIDDDTKAALLSLGDVFAMPVRRVGASVEGFGIVYLEAAWYGTPAIAGKVGGARDAVADGETGLVVDGDDVEAVSRALNRLVSDADLRAAMGQAARERVASQGVWDRKIETFAEALGL